MNMNRATLCVGLTYLVLGTAFILEAAGVWALGVADLRLVGPLTLVVVGLIVTTSGIDRRRRTAEEVEK